MSDDLLAGLVAGFAAEADELAARATRDLLDLETPASPDAAGKLYDRVARALHTLKGSAATVGLDDAARLAHRMEDVLRPLHQAEAPLPGPTLDVMLAALDAMVAHVRARGAGKAAASLSTHTHALEALLPDVPEEPPAGGGTTGAWPADELPFPTEPTSPQAHAAPADDGLAEGSDTWRVRRKDVLGLVKDLERLRELRLRLERRRRDVVGAVDQLKEHAPSDLLVALERLATELGADAEEAGQIVESSEESVKAIGTLPVQLLFEPLRRAAREVAREAGKDVRLSLVGGELAVDRRILDALRGALVHVVRNAVSHGIEAPEVRESRGKHREGAIVVRFEQQGNVLQCSIEDDGGGIDLARVRETAKAAGRETEALTDEQAAQLIFEPGFSTAKAVTNASGRGVGLDVVRSEVMLLDGTIQVHTRAGQGTRFVATVPVELGSSVLLVVRVGEHRFGVPAMQVGSLQSTRRDALHVGRGRVQMEVRGRLVPVHSLGALLGTTPPSVPGDRQPLVAMQVGDSAFVLAVDDIEGDQDLVIRPLPVQLRALNAYQGAATLGGGELMLVLRPDWLAERTGRAADTVPSERRVLVVDDSLTARALHRTILETGGFTVHTAGSAAQALEQLRGATYDVVVCDIGMEGMDGFALTRTLRARADTREVPIVLVSAHDGDAERTRGMAAGADAFLSKRDCVSGRLLAEVTQVTGRRRAS